MSEQGVAELQLARLSPRHGDILIAKLDGLMTGEAHRRLMENIAPHLPPGVRLLIIDKSVELSIMTREQIEQRATE